MRSWMQIGGLFAMLCGCGSSPVYLEGTWTDGDIVWRIAADSTWSLQSGELDKRGNWSLSDGTATFFYEDGEPPTQVAPVVAGDQLAITAETGTGLVPVSGFYPQLSGGRGFAGTSWGESSYTRIGGGSCSFQDHLFTISFDSGGAARSEAHDLCQPANMGIRESRAGTWTLVGDDAVTTQTAVVFGGLPQGDSQPRSWARFGDAITDRFFTRTR